MECMTYRPEAYKRLTTRHVELLCPLQLPKSRCFRRAPAIYESFQAPGWWESTCSLISVKRNQILQIPAGPVASNGKSKCLYWVIPWCGKFPAWGCQLKHYEIVNTVYVKEVQSSTSAFARKLSKLWDSLEIHLCSTGCMDFSSMMSGMRWQELQCLKVKFVCCRCI